MSQIFKILTNIQHFDKYSKFWQIFKILTNIQNFEFLPFFVITYVLHIFLSLSRHNFSVAQMQHNCDFDKTCQPIAICAVVFHAVDPLPLVSRSRTIIPRV